MIIFRLYDTEKKYVSFSHKSLFAWDPNNIESHSFEDKIKVALGFGLCKDSEFKAFFDFHLRRLREIGVLDQLRAKHGIGQPAQLQQDNTAVQLGLFHVVEPLILITVGMVIAVVLVVREWLQKRADGMSRLNSDKKYYLK